MILSQIAKQLYGYDNPGGDFDTAPADVLAPYFDLAELAGICVAKRLVQMNRNLCRNGCADPVNDFVGELMPGFCGRGA